MNAKNAMFLFVLALVVMTIVGFSPEAQASDAREHQLCHVQNMPQGTFIKHVEASLAADPSGNRVVEGCNATPRQFLQGINQVPALKEGGFALQDVNQLPEFLRKLEERPFSEACLSGMNGREIVLTCKQKRAAKPGEIGYFYGNIMVFAGDCMNTVSYVAATTLGSVEVRGRRYNPLVRARTEPFASQQRAVSGGCSLGDDRYFGVMVFEAVAARHECAVRTMLPYGGRLGERKGGGIGGTYHDLDRFSRTCGAAMRGAVKAGEFNFSSTPHRFEVLVQNGEREEVIFTGTVIGNKITADSEENAGLLHESGKLIFLPEEYTTGDLVIRYLEPNGLRTPTASGTGERVENIQRGCRVGAFYAIDADGTSTTVGDIAYEN